MTIDPRLLFQSSCDCVVAAAEPAQFPESDMAEIALIGRSNVGKSSLINALVGRKAARASNTPGRTQQIVFFELGKQMMLADLPGYGFAKAPLEVKKRWNNLVTTYLKKRQQIKIVCVLIDARHGAMKNDEEMMEVLDRAAVPYRLILTKTDKIKPAEVTAVLESVRATSLRHPAAYPEVMATSADSGAGVEELRAVLAGYMV